MYEVSFEYFDLENEKQIVKELFEDKNEAYNVYNKITKTTKEMLNKYGIMGIYHPYRKIRIKELK